ncbi:MAG: UbiA family prenyltransferase [Candidatus Limnocylindria bacterium]
MPAGLRVIHPAPAIAVVALSAALALILADQTRLPVDARVALIVLSVAGSQVFTGATNDWADRDRDAEVRPEKPIPAGELTERSALAIAGAGLALQLATSAVLGLLPLLLGAAASASALAYNLWLSRTPASVLPYLVSFGLLPAWIGAGVGVPLDRVVAASLLAAPFASAAHLANTARDFEADASAGSRDLAQVLGRRTSHRVALGLALMVGVAVGVGLLVDGRLSAPGALLGLIGLVAVAQGVAGPRQLWYGMLVAAVCWTVAWALSTG